MTQGGLQPGSHEKGPDSLKIHVPVPQDENFNPVHRYQVGSSSSIRRLLAAAGISFPLILGTAAASEACGLNIGGRLDVSDASDAEPVPETSDINDANDTKDVNDANTDADAMDSTDSTVDSPIDTGIDSGPTATFSNAADKNNCIHWLTTNGGMTQALKSDNHVCEPKPVAPMPIVAGYDIYVHSKDFPNNHKIRFVTPINVTTYNTKCSAYSLPPNKAEMETELLGGGYIATSNAATLPDVELTNAGCTDGGAAFVVHVAP